MGIVAVRVTAVTRGWKLWSRMIPSQVPPISRIRTPGRTRARKAGSTITTITGAFGGLRAQLTLPPDTSLAIARGFTNRANYRLRVLLIAGGLTSLHLK